MMSVICHMRATTHGTAIISGTARGRHTMVATKGALTAVLAATSMMMIALIATVVMTATTIFVRTTLCTAATTTVMRMAARTMTPGGSRPTPLL